MMKTSEMWFEIEPDKFTRQFKDYKVDAEYWHWDCWRFWFTKGSTCYVRFLYEPKDIDAEKMDIFCDQCVSEIEKHPIIYQIYWTKKYKAEELTEDICNECCDLIWEWCLPSWPLTLKGICAWLEAEWYAITEIMPMIRFLRTDAWFQSLRNWMWITIGLN